MIFYSNKERNKFLTIWLCVALFLVTFSVRAVLKAQNGERPSKTWLIKYGDLKGNNYSMQITEAENVLDALGQFETNTANETLYVHGACRVSFVTCSY